MPIADKVIFGKKCQKVSNVFKETQMFRVYHPSSVWEKTVVQYYAKHQY